MKARVRIALAVLTGAALAGAGGGAIAVASTHSTATPHVTAVTRTAAGTLTPAASAATLHATGVTQTAPVTHTSAAPASHLKWHPLHLLGGWTAASGRYYGVPSYAIQDGILYLSGILQAPHPTNATEVAVLPPGARPAHILWLLYYNFGGIGTNLVGNMEIEPSGAMFIYAPASGPISNPSLQSISFPLSS